MTIHEAFELVLQRRQSGHSAEVDSMFQQVLAADIADCDVWHQLGMTAHQSGWNEAAVEFFGRAVDINPKSAVLFSNLGNLLSAVGRLEEGLAACRQAIKLQPGYAEAHNNLGITLGKLDRHAQAVEAFRTAVKLKDNYADAYSNMGNALAMLDRMEEAVTIYRKALELRPDYANASFNLGVALGRFGRYEEARAACRRASELDPSHTLADFSRALFHLVEGDFAQGLPLYEVRWETPEFTSPRRNFPQPMWDGGPLDGRTLLIHAEQGFGDSIQFIRYATLAAERGGQVIVEAPEALLEVFFTVKGINQLVPQGEALPHFDLHIPMMSLPLAFGTTLATIPQSVPYLSANAPRCAFWREWLAESDASLKVGLVWAGRPTHTGDRQRSMHLRQFLPIFRVPDVDFVSLQFDRGIEQIAQLPGRQPIRDASADIHDFADTAALVAQLDLVIAVDTAVAHLAGALGKPVWVLLPLAPDWRWMLGREDSPWYPTMRLFRQQRAMEWDPVIVQVRKQLQIFADSRD
jgi:tetratricopeptide (TPR) repeat protein